MILNSFLKTSLLGVDIQPRGVYIAQLKRHKQAFLVRNLLFIPLPHTIFADGKIKQWDQLTQRLAEGVYHAKLRHGRVAIQIPIQLIDTQRLSLPLHLSSDTHIAMEIKAYTERHLGLKEGHYSDYHQLSDGSQTKTEIIFWVTSRAYLARYLLSLQAAGLMVKVVDVDTYVLKRVTTANLIGKIPTSFLIACGLAMREEPQW